MLVDTYLYFKPNLFWWWTPSLSFLSVPPCPIPFLVFFILLFLKGNFQANPRSLIELVSSNNPASVPFLFAFSHFPSFPPNISDNYFLFLVAKQLYKAPMSVCMYVCMYERYQKLKMLNN